ncbi:MAG: hypothetical protein U5N85_12925 [Arcicella sp.]|nr:hypothetical protein [Arcicella sp.]
MQYLKLGLTFLFGVLMIFAGINHFRNPVMYLPFVPDFLPQQLVNQASGILEIVLGVGVFIPQFRQRAAFGIFLLMIIFLPLHVWDVFRDKPAIGSHQIALIRLPIQFLLIFIGWFIGKK